MKISGLRFLAILKKIETSLGKEREMKKYYED